MHDPMIDSRIYLLADENYEVAPDGPAIVRPDGVREVIPPVAFHAIRHVVDVMLT